MIFPLQVTLQRGFTLSEMQLWVESSLPQQIEMTDRQYAHYANMCGLNRKHFNKIPIVFIEAPQAAI